MLHYMHAYKLSLQIQIHFEVGTKKPCSSIQPFAEDILPIHRVSNINGILHLCVNFYLIFVINFGAKNNTTDFGWHAVIYYKDCTHLSTQMKQYATNQLYMCNVYWCSFC